MALCSKKCWIACELIEVNMYLQVPELFGPIRTIAEGRGETVLIGTTKNFVLQGSLDGDFIPITQVRCQNLLSVIRHKMDVYF